MNTKRWRLLCCLALLCPGSAYAETLIFTPIDDAFTQNGNNVNGPNLRIETGNRERITYVKFDLSDLPVLEIASVRLELQESVDQGSGPIVVSSASSNNWDEDTINGDNAPFAVMELDRFEGAVTDGTVLDFDVSSFVNGQGVFSFIVTSESATDGNDVAFASSEFDGDVAVPQLIISLVPEPTSVLLGLAALGGVFAVRRRS